MADEKELTKWLDFFHELLAREAALRLTAEQEHALRFAATLATDHGWSLDMMQSPLLSKEDRLEHIRHIQDGLPTVLGIVYICVSLILQYI